MDFSPNAIKVLERSNITGNRGYRFPGGSIDIRRSNHDQAYNESKEEARLIINHIRYSGESYHRMKTNYYKGRNSKSITWDGTYNKVYIAEYVANYTGNVKYFSRDDSMCINGRFVSLPSIYDMLIDEHKKACIYNKTR